MGQMVRRERERISLLLDRSDLPHSSHGVTTLTPAATLPLPAGPPCKTRATPFGRPAERIVDLALAAFGTPAALACFTDPQLGPTLVHHGLDDCAAALCWADWQVLARRSGPCVVRDAERESWLARHPLVTGPAAIRFYAAAPLRDRDGQQQGVLAILAPEPRPLGLAPPERARLQTLADLLMTERGAERQADEVSRHLAEMERVLRQRDAQLRNQAHIIQEMDHRIRNGLQMVCDMLGLQSLEGQEEACAAQLHAAAGRILAVAEVHTVLQRRPGAGLLSARACLEELLSAFRRLCQGSGRHVRLRAGADTMVSALDAPRLGLVAWELLANAMRHGQGNVTLELRTEPVPHRLCLVAEDEGPGSERLRHAARNAGSGSGLGLIRVIAGGEAARVCCGPPTRVSIALDLPSTG